MAVVQVSMQFVHIWTGESLSGWSQIIFLKYTRKFTRRASKRRSVLFATVWREPGVMIRRVLFAAGWREPGIVCYHIYIVKVKVTR